MSSPARLFSCVQSNQICASPLNLSPAKQQYSFSREDRFKVPAKYSDNIYNLPSMRMTRKASFGYGKNTDLEHGKHPHNHTPSPDSYQIDSFVETNRSHQKGMAAHIGRDKTAPRSYVELDRIKFPGPGRYDELRFNDTPKWTMRPINNPERTSLHNQFEKTTVKNNPGPAEYQFDDKMNRTGKYFTGKYKSSGSKVWNPPSSQRFNKSSTGVPGAGNYHPVNEMSDSGKYVLSSHRGSGKRRFDHEFRNNFVDEPAKITKTPGPGNYRHTSQFGHYDQIAQLSSRSQLQ